MIDDQPAIHFITASIHSRRDAIATPQFAGEPSTGIIGIERAGHPGTLDSVGTDHSQTGEYASAF